jgi:5-methyltetrahydrofolate--homocysteine methyltransferase
VPKGVDLDYPINQKGSIRNTLVTFEAIKTIRQTYPEIHITCGLSNISFGMPLRSVINQTFMAMCIQMGIDNTIFDPMAASRPVR